MVTRHDSSLRPWCVGLALVSEPQRRILPQQSVSADAATSSE